MSENISERRLIFITQRVLVLCILDGFGSTEQLSGDNVAREFKEQAHLKTDLKKFGDNWDHIFAKPYKAELNGNQYKEKGEKMSDENLDKGMTSPQEEITKSRVKQLEERLDLAEKEVILRGENFNKISERLKDAEEVVAFYGDRSNWRYSGDDRFNNTFTYADSSIVITGKTKDTVGGKRAREYQAKYQVKEIVK